MEKNDVESRHCLVVMGGSAGSLEVILQMLQKISTVRFPIIVVVHRKSTSESLLAEVMSQRSILKVKEAEEKEKVQPGTVYLAPADYHLLVENDLTLSLDYSEKVNFSRPSIDVTFESAAAACGKRLVGILLSGANADGVAGLAAIRKAGGLCIVQDPHSAEIAFMPESAISDGPVDRVLNATDIAAFIDSLG